MKKKMKSSKKDFLKKNRIKFKTVNETNLNDLIINNNLMYQQRFLHKTVLKTLTLNEDISFISDNFKSFKKELDSLSEMGEMESLRLQMAMDTISKMMSTMSNLLKKMNETSSGIISNFK